jgi:2-polyprenyl-3-methyl-5-hydroxy-6-metoxy-1,4-benzoquinol methylase
MTDSSFWKDHFSHQHAEQSQSHSQRLDFSNDRVQYQTYAWLLESLGPLRGRSCLDAGCGTGELALAMTALGAEVTAFDIAQPTIDILSARHPTICWRVADLAHLDEADLAPAYDLVVASEVLQYVDAANGIASLWTKVRPGGRLAAVIPNADCPIVQHARSRFEGRYNGIALNTLVSTLKKLPEANVLRWRAVSFLDDQTLFPYGLGAWHRDADVALQPPPNRLQFVAMRGT